jgi:hypothetical protein
MRSVYNDYSELQRLFLALTLGTAICFGGPVRAEERPSGVDSRTVREVKRLIAQLDADTRNERAQAHDALLALGPAILPLLPDDQAITSAAARQTLREIRLRLQHDSALASLRPSQVTLQGTFPLGVLLQRISAETGNEFDTSALDVAMLKRSLTVDFKSRSFWNACDQLVDAVGLEYGLASKGRLQLVQARSGSTDRPLAVANDGAFRVAVTSVRIRPSVVSRTSYALRIDWSLRAEPRLRPLFASIAGQDLRAREGQVVFRPISPAAKLELSMNEGQEPLQLASDFEFPLSAMATPRVDFGGSFAVEMAAGPVPFVFNNLAAPDQPAQRAGSVTVRMMRAAFPQEGQPGEARVEISTVYDQRGPAFESYRTWMYHNPIWLETKDGHRLKARPLAATRQQDDGGVAVEYNFADVAGAPAEYRLLYVAPTLVTSTPVQFQLRNLPTTRADHPGARP